ncbi:MULTISPECIES: STAS domain-containing protein [unclassified Streptomyces]|uniref:STAS domain-containing protein n=1 Tax=unclassified Streptomyces TaxID=2593676 RepID=UPI004042EB0A
MLLSVEPAVVTTSSTGVLGVAKVRGSMDYTTQPDLSAHLTQVIARARHTVVLDLTDVSFCDSAGLNVLLDARRQRREQEGSWRWPASLMSLQRALQTTGADQVVPVYGAVAEATLIT